MARGLCASIKPYFWTAFQVKTQNKIEMFAFYNQYNINKYNTK